jgi:hypothetical protein
MVSVAVSREHFAATGFESPVRRRLELLNGGITEPQIPVTAPNLIQSNVVADFDHFGR